MLIRILITLLTLRNSWLVFNILIIVLQPTLASDYDKQGINCPKIYWKFSVAQWLTCWTSGMPYIVQDSQPKGWVRAPGWPTQPTSAWTSEWVTLNGWLIWRGKCRHHSDAIPVLALTTQAAQMSLPRGRQKRTLMRSGQGQWAPVLCQQSRIPPSGRWSKTKGVHIIMPK